MYHNVAALFNRYLRTMKPVAMMTVTMTIAQKTKTPLMKITTMSQIQTNLLVKIGQTWKGKQKKMMKSMKTKKGEVTNLHTDHHTKTGDQKITLYLSLNFFQKLMSNLFIFFDIQNKNINCILFCLSLDPLKKAVTAQAIIQAVEMGTTQHPKISIAAVTQIKEKEIGTVVLVVNTASLRKRCGLDDSNISYFSYITHIYSIC